MYNLFGKSVTTVLGGKPLPPGKANIELRFDYDGGGFDDF